MVSRGLLAKISLLVLVCSGAAERGVLAADLERGKTLFSACLACHDATPGAVGPALTGLQGRKAGSAPGFRYSRAMRESGVIWTEVTLGQYLKDPQGFIPGNRMAFDGFENPDDVKAVIAYVLSR